MNGTEKQVAFAAKFLDANLAAIEEVRNAFPNMTKLIDECLAEKDCLAKSHADMISMVSARLDSIKSRVETEASFCIDFSKFSASILNHGDLIDKACF